MSSGSGAQNKKEVKEEEIKTKMTNLFSSFFIKSGGDDNDENYPEEEGQTPGQAVDLKEQSF